VAFGIRHIGDNCHLLAAASLNYAAEDYAVAVLYFSDHLNVNGTV